MQKPYSLSMSLMMVVLALSTLSLPALAEHEDACKDDKAKLCSSVDQSDHKAVWDCLKKNQDQLSDACKASMKHRHHKKEESSDQSGGASAPSGGTSAPAAPPAAQ